MRMGLHQPNYIPWLGYFHKIRECDVFVFLDTMQFEKNGFQNRNKIKTPDGIMWLTVPVTSDSLASQKLIRVQTIDNEWRAKHLKSLKFNYSRAPFFKQFYPQIEALYEMCRSSSLSMNNVVLIHGLCRLFGLKAHLCCASELSVADSGPDQLLSICKTLGADEFLSGVSTKKYIDEKKFAERGVRITYQEFTHPVYSQVWDGFESNLSVLDSLFNCGKLL